MFFFYFFADRTSTSNADFSSSSSSFSPASIFRSIGSIFSFGGTQDVSFRAILVLLTLLLCANSLLFYQMWSLESRMSNDAFNSKVSTSAYDHLKFWDAATILGATEENERTTEQWLQLLRKQEAVHQMELEKWHEMLEMATELLRKVSLFFIHGKSVSVNSATLDLFSDRRFIGEPSEEHSSVDIAKIKRTFVLERRRR